MTPETILELVGQAVVYIGAGTTLAFFVFKHFAKSWIENQFAQRLEQSRQDHAREIQRLRVKIDSMLSGTLKIKEKEFEILPVAWGLLCDAHGFAILVSPVQSFPDVDNMTSAELEDLLERSEFLEFEKEKIRQAPKKLEEYQTVHLWHQILQVKNSCRDLHNYVVKYRIFLPPGTREKLTTLSKGLWETVGVFQNAKQMGDRKLQGECWTKFREILNPQFDELETAIYARLQSHGDDPHGDDPHDDDDEQ